jgi:ParB-like chromosome segregation protein Spo0J
MHLPLDEIGVPNSRRDVDPEAVKRLVSSIKEIGLRHPITVRSLQGKFYLVAGRHRLEATREIGEDRIAAVVAKFDAIDAEMWEISENLHRADLSKLERDTQLARWIELKESRKVSVQSAPKPSGGRPESGISAAARELGVEETDAKRAVKVCVRAGKGGRTRDRA